jgi:hypothetical protein
MPRFRASPAPDVVQGGLQNEHDEWSEGAVIVRKDSDEAILRDCFASLAMTDYQRLTYFTPGMICPPLKKIFSR